MIKSTLCVFGIVLTVSLWGCRSNNPRRDDSKLRLPDSKTSRVKVSPFKDGTYSALVKYHNPSIDYSTSFVLDVEVSAGKVVQIYFENNTLSDDDLVTPAALDEYGNAKLLGERGNTYQVHIDP